MTKRWIRKHTAKDAKVFSKLYGTYDAEVDRFYLNKKGLAKFNRYAKKANKVVKVV